MAKVERDVVVLTDEEKAYYKAMCPLVLTRGGNFKVIQQKPKSPAYNAAYDAFAAATRGPDFKTDHPCLSRGYHNSIDPGVCKDCGIECSDILCPTCGQTQIVYEDGTLSQPPLGQCWLCHNHYGVNPFTNETQVRHPEREAVLCMDPRPPEDLNGKI